MPLNTTGWPSTSRRTSLPVGAREVRQPDAKEWETYPVLAADDAFFGAVKPSIESFATGYADTEAVLAAVRSESGFALIDSGALNGLITHQYHR